MIRKFVSAREAVSRIPDNAVVAISGFNAATAPFYLIETLLQHYRETGRPKNLFIISDAIQAIPGFGLDEVGKLIVEEPGQDFVRGFLLPFYGWAPELQKAVMKNPVEAYTWPIGILTRWLRTVAVGAPSVFSGWASAPSSIRGKTGVSSTIWRGRGKRLLLNTSGSTGGSTGLPYDHVYLCEECRLKSSPA